MNGWKFRLVERDGELVPDVHYENQSDYDTKEEYEDDCELELAERMKDGND